MAALRSRMAEALGRSPTPGVRHGADKLAWKEEVERELGALSVSDLAGVVELWRMRYEDVERARLSVGSRANNLLIFVGVTTAGATLVAASIEETSLWLAVAIGVVGLVLLSAVVATAYFAVGVQLVSYWDSPWLDLDDKSWRSSSRVRLAVEYYVAAHQNRLRLQGPVVLLSRAQRFARVALVTLALLALLSVMATISPDARGTSDCASTAAYQHQCRLDADHAPDSED